jgi:DNA-binding transcriptional MerR regulator
MKFSGVLHQSFSTAEVARLTGLTPRQLDHWDRLGFLRPSLERASGYGSTRRYSFADVVRLRVAARLRAAGIGLPRIRRCAEALARLEPEGAGDLAEARLLVAGNRVLWARSDRELVDLLKEGQMVLVFSLGDAVEEAAGAVARLSREVESEDLPAASRTRRSRRHFS